jgi:drug/metabolite transporter (DMT)-like permease
MFFAERLSSLQWVGSAIVLAGVAILSISGVAPVSGVSLQAEQSV